MAVQPDLFGDFMNMSMMFLVSEDCARVPLTLFKRTRRNKVKGITNVKLDTESAIERFKAAHGETYDYSKVEYKNNRTNVWVGCSLHGYYQQNPVSHWSGYGCTECGERPRNKNRKVN